MKTYDVVVIGGGPAGMMAAGRAAECGAKVVLLEKNISLGKKLLLTGGGRCNVTNAQFDRDTFLSKFGKAKKFLFSPISRFGVQDTLDFFHLWGMPTKVEEENRVFPVTDDAQSVKIVLSKYMERGGVTVLSGVTVAGLETKGGEISGVRIYDGETISAKSYVLATGGKSHPETGSTGEGFLWLQKIGHTIVSPRASLVPFRVMERWAHKLSGVSISEAKLTVFQKGKKQENKRGKLLFTHFGLSGPLALNMSRRIDELLDRGEVTVSVDILPQRNFEELDRDLQTIFEEQKNRQIKNALEGFLPPLCIPVFLSITKIDSETPVHSITRDERLALGRAIKDLRLKVSGLLGEEKAIVTSGGVEFSEIDGKYMRSRLYPNLYLAGDILNIDRPSGGYSLQVCWTTGFVAGSSAAGSEE